MAFTPFSDLDLISFGFDPIFKNLADYSKHNRSFPPHNIIRKNTEGSRSFVIEMAVAGYKQNEISVSVNDRTLLITGKKDQEESNDSTYLVKNIASRDFSNKFLLGDYVEIIDVSLQDGILSILLEEKVPEVKKPKLIPINVGKS